MRYKELLEPKHDFDIDAYHGTKADFDSFDPSLTRDIGMHFGTKGQANRATKSLLGNTPDGANIIPVKLRLKNPLRVPDMFDTTRTTYINRAKQFTLNTRGFRPSDAERHAIYVAAKLADNARRKAGGDWGAFDTNLKAYQEPAEAAAKAFWQTIQVSAERQGYDGFVYANRVEGKGDSYVIFNPKHVRSRFANFDPAKTDSNKLMDGVGDEIIRPSAESLAAVVQRHDQGTIIGIGAHRLAIYRIGPIADTRGRGIFFGGSMQDAEEYSGLHDQQQVQKYIFSAKNVLLAPNQWAAYSHFTKKPFDGNAFDKIAYELGGSGKAGVYIDTVVAKSARDSGFDAVLYSHPRPPAVVELQIVKFDPKALQLAASDPLMDDVQQPVAHLGSTNRSLNSLGQPIAHTPAAIDQFWRWFGKSKTVDKLGRPLVLFHGSKTTFRRFNPKKSNSNTQTGVPHSAFVFTNSADVAQSYAGQKTENWAIPDPRLAQQYHEMIQSDDITGAIAFFKQHAVQDVKHYTEGGNVMPVYLRMARPLKVNARGETWREIWYKDDRWTTNELMEFAMHNGYDGLIVRNVYDRQEGSGKTGDTYAVFSPTQIKSAIGNRGSFHSDIHDIDESDFD